MSDQTTPGTEGGKNQGTKKVALGRFPFLFRLPSAFRRSDSEWAVRQAEKKVEEAVSGLKNICEDPSEARARLHEARAAVERLPSKDRKPFEERIKAEEKKLDTLGEACAILRSTEAKPKDPK